MLSKFIFNMFRKSDGLLLHCIDNQTSKQDRYLLFQVNGKKKEQERQKITFPVLLEKYIEVDLILSNYIFSFFSFFFYDERTSFVVHSTLQMTDKVKIKLLSLSLSITRTFLLNYEEFNIIEELFTDM